MDIQAFAEKYRLRINDKKLTRRFKIRQHSQPTIYGRYGEIGEDFSFGPNIFVVRFLAVPRNAVMTGALRNRYRKALAAGLKLKWKGHDESSFHFDASNDIQARLALRLVGAGIRRRRILTDTQRKALLETLVKARKMRSLKQSLI